MKSTENALRMPPQVAPCARMMAGSALGDGSGLDASWGFNWKHLLSKAVPILTNVATGNLPGAGIQTIEALTS